MMYNIYRALYRSDDGRELHAVVIDESAYGAEKAAQKYAAEWAGLGFYFHSIEYRSYLPAEYRGAVVTYMGGGESFHCDAADILRRSAAIVDGTSVEDDEREPEMAKKLRERAVRFERFAGKNPIKTPV